LIVRFDNLTAAHADLNSVKSGLDSHIVDLNAELDSLNQQKTDMISLLSKRDAEISLLKQGKSDQAFEISQIEDANAKLTSELKTTSDTLRAANETIAIFRAQMH
jgi:chromosome segregation ATPase